MLAEARSDLRPGETLLTVFPARSDAGSASGSGLLPAELTLVVIAAEHLSRRRQTREQARESMFPLAPRMIVGVTNARLMMWSVRPGWRLGSFLGYVSRDRILQAAAPTRGSGWRSVHIYLAEEPTVSIRVPDRVADGLVRALSGPSCG